LDFLRGLVHRREVLQVSFQMGEALEGVVVYSTAEKGEEKMLVSNAKGIEIMINPEDYPDLFPEEEVEQVSGGEEDEDD